ncbi:Hydroxyethylthiazole kinase family-domain-containing protein [Scheffersomyces coipomensis]|uniref:Hydroxyethylthiazole kinase family-domain-containing protein n=1 Tax=Scheffersomyces coipomensis TaxID=1788519 RepID=UPI00315D89CB
MIEVDYSVYLVTDSTMVPESSTFLKQVEDSINNGATLIQLREKKLSTLDFIERAKQVHELTKQKGIPLIINDRIDIALAIDAEGVHVGQDDMPAILARKLLGPNKILGVTCSNVEEAKTVAEEGIADYVGLGTVYKTNTKKDVKDPEGTGPIGIRKMLQVLFKYQKDTGKKIYSVAIGGINHSNANKVLYQCSIPGYGLDGLAVVSCIMANEDAGKATRELVEIILSRPEWTKNITETRSKCQLEDKLKSLRQNKPLVHHITNNVVKNFSANVTLAIGASPIMSELPEEYEEFASTIPNLSLVLNLGTPSSNLMEVFKHAIKVYNKHGKHILFDPVACGASKARLECSRILLNTGQVSVIKGNVGEISSIWKLTSTYEESTGNQASLMQGVDSIADLSEDQIIEIGREVSIDFKTVVVITGVNNYVIDGYTFEKIKGGHQLMSYITGTGCSLGSTIGAFLASAADGNFKSTFNVFDAVVGAVELYNLAGNNAGKVSSSPGTFMTNFIDQLYSMSVAQ